MANSMFRNTFFLFGAFIAIGFNVSQAQDFIVTTKGDTLPGKVKLISNGLERRIQLVNEAKERSSYTIFQVKEAVISNQRFHPVKLGQSFTYMKLIKEGYLSLYGFQIENQSTYDGQYLLKKDGGGMEVPNLTFKKNMAKFLSECPTVAADIASGAKGKSDIAKIIDAFNLCIENNTKLSISQQPTTTVVSSSVLDPWNTLEQKVKESSLSDKADALEMIADLKAKLLRGNKIPKFLSEGLRAMLSSDPRLTDELQLALKSIEN
jgi:hypothetical protein